MFTYGVIPLCNQHGKRFLSQAVVWTLLIRPLAAEPQYPPALPGGVESVTIDSPALLSPSETLKPGIEIARTPPRVTIRYYPGQNEPGNPWSAWGDGLAVGDVYYSAIGDHKAPQGNAFVYRFDRQTGRFEQIVNVRKTIRMPQGHYTPGKIHTRIDLGSDGWLYFATHRGSTRVTTEEFHYQGDWILRHHPERKVTEIVVHAPLAKQCLPTGLLDPERLIYYAGTADGDRKIKQVQFLAYDVKNRKLLYHDDAGPYRAAIFARSTGRVYFHQHGRRGQVLPLVRFDPENPGPPVTTQARVGLRACTRETPEGLVYTVDGDQLWEFNTHTETARSLGPVIVGQQDYIATLDIDPSNWRYLYYIAGAHGSSYRDGSPLVQYDLKTKRRKVIGFFHPALFDATGYTCMGSYGLAVSPDGSTVYITWNGNQGGPQRNRLRFNTCALTVVRIPSSERQP